MEYMAQRMDDQITGAISENERLIEANIILTKALEWIAENGPVVGWGTRKVAIEALQKANIGMT